MGVFSSKKPSLSEQNIATLIGEDCLIKGDIHAKECMRIDGIIEGNVIADQGLILGERGTINGNVKGDEVIVYGTINGDLHAKKLDLHATGKIKGAVSVAQVQMELGAIYNGSISMQSESSFSTPKGLNPVQIEQASASAAKAS